MKQIKLKSVVIATSTFACAALLSVGLSEQGSLSLSVESAQARVGRPLTPVSVAGVARRQTRRAGYGYGYGYGAAALGAGVVAAGTAAAVAATSPGWGWGDNSYYAGRPYYGGGAWGAGPYAASTEPARPWNLHETYYGGGPWYGFSGWDDYAARGGIVCKPGSIVTGPDGQHYPCQ